MPVRQSDKTEQKKQTRRSGKGPRPVAAILPKVTRKALGKQGFAHAALITDWKDVVGPELARVSQPERLSFRHGERRNGNLQVRVLGAVATEMQHLAPVVIERVNRYFGFRAVSQLKIRQTTHIASRAEAPAPKRPTGPPREEAAQRFALLLATVKDDELEEILVCLAQGVLGRDAATIGRQKDKP